MTLANRIRLAWKALTERASPENPANSLWELLDQVYGGGSTKAGVDVGPDTAMRISAFGACVRILSEGVASLPALIYERDGRSKQRADDHPLYRILHDETGTMSSFTYFETGQSHLCTDGNHMALIERDGAGRVGALRLMLPGELTPKADAARRTVVYEQSGTHVNRVWAADDVLHVPGLGYDGIRGYSPVAYHREALGLSLAAEQFGARFFGDGARPGGVMSTDQVLQPGKVEELSKQWDQAHRGIDRSYRVAIMHSGLKFQQVTISPEDAQFLETRKFQVAEIARIFRVPLWMIQLEEKDTSWGSGIEQMGIGFVVYTLRPWLIRWEREINRKLFTQRERQRFFFEFKIDGLLRGDAKARAEAYQLLILAGVMNRNEAREHENLNPAEGLDDFLVPMNMGVVGQPPAAAA